MCEILNSIPDIIEKEEEKYNFCEQQRTHLKQMGGKKKKKRSLSKEDPKEIIVEVKKYNN